MQLEITYKKEGICFSIENGKGRFPLNQDNQQQFLQEDWLRLNAVEQIWYDGLLHYDPRHKLYWLAPEDYYLLDGETKRILDFPAEDAYLAIAEHANIGSSNYSIIWYPTIGNRSAGKTIIKGNVIEYAGQRKILTKQQYDLVKAIDQHELLTDITARARYHAQVASLANKANADMSAFMQKREFYFADSADYRLESADDHEVHFEPVISGVPDTVQQKLPEQIHSHVQIRTGEKRTTIFTSKEAQEQYNMISALPHLSGEQVPEFMENPYAYLPENFEIDLSQFSDRVKGLKIRTSSAVPYVHVEPSPSQTGWYQINTGYRIEPNDETFEDMPIVYTTELREIMQSAAENGQKYVYYQGQWVKINPELIYNFEDITKKIYCEYGTQVSEEQFKYVLDIYDNLQGIEYNEKILDIRSELIHNYVSYIAPESFNGTLMSHQKEGYIFLKGHYENRIGVLLADDMGLGKTVQIIAFLSYLYDLNALATTLIVMPKTLLDNWKREINCFLPIEKSIYIHNGVQRYRSCEIIQQYDIVLTTYETVARDQTMLGRIAWSCVICDEVQKIKNFNTIAASAIKGMNTKFRVAVTGTPVENRLSELWSIVDFVQPGLLDSYRSFKANYENPISSNSSQSEGLVKQLVDQLSPIFLRRIKDDVLKKQLPEKIEISVPLKMDASTEQLYRQIILDLSKQQGMQLAIIQKLLEVCSHPQLVIGGATKRSDDELIAMSPKLQWTIEKLDEIFAKGEKVILFTKYKMMQAILRYVISSKFGINADVINGEITGNRKEIIDNFSQKLGAGAILLSPKAAGVGLTITAANHVIHYTREWNPAVENQATDRAYRIGQQKPVTVYYPYLTSSDFVTVEERLDELLSQKRKLMKNVIVPVNLEISIEEFTDTLYVV